MWADLDPSAGHEQTKRRPLIVVSNNKFNTHCNLTMIVPITNADNSYPLHLNIGDIPTEDGKGSISGFAEAEQLKSLDLSARNAIKVGRLNETGSEQLLSLVLGCLISPEMSIITC